MKIKAGQIWCVKDDSRILNSEGLSCGDLVLFDYHFKGNKFITFSGGSPREANIGPRFYEDFEYVGEL